jgi:hypothetical protein
VFRLLSCIYALGFQIAIYRDLDRPALGWLLFAVLIGWSAACAVAYLHGFGRRTAWVLAKYTELSAPDAVSTLIASLLLAACAVAIVRSWVGVEPDDESVRVRCAGSAAVIV